MIYGYGCVSSPKILRNDIEAIYSTKAYKAIKKTFLRLGLPVENIYIDLITGTYRKRKYLEYILRTSRPGDCIVVENISALGFNPAELQKNYKSLHSHALALYVASEYLSSRETIYSTALSDMTLSLDCAPGSYNAEALIEKRCKMMLSEKAKTNRGPAYMDRPAGFKKVYWLYENYFLAEKDTYHNRTIDMGKKLFYRLAKEYETIDPDYENDLIEQDKLYGISLKPKRHGAVPADFDKFLEKISAGTSLKDACNDMGYDYIPPIDIERYVLKHEGGRKAMAEANKLRLTDLAKELTKDVLF